jgi:hypothetical protein
MEKQIGKFNLKPFANMLDAGGATATAYQIPRSAPFWLVVVDGEGKIAYNASRGWHWSSGPDKGKYVHHTQLEKSLETCKGILGIPEIPGVMSPVAHLFDLQQFGLLETKLKEVEAREKSDAAQGFVLRVRDRVEEQRKQRVQMIHAMAEADPLQAYRDAEAFVAAFPNAPEKNEVSQVARTLMKKPEVSRELQAEAAYRKILVPEMQKATRLSSFNKKIQPLADNYEKAYGATKYGAMVKSALEAYAAALSRGGE